MTFKSDPKVAPIDHCAFYACFASNSLCIPKSIRVRPVDRHLSSAFATVIFESGMSVQTLIEWAQADLEGNFAIYPFKWADVMLFSVLQFQLFPVSTIQSNC
jgi:hypothetical protein